MSPLHSHKCLSPWHCQACHACLLFGEERLPPPPPPCLWIPCTLCKLHPKGVPAHIVHACARQSPLAGPHFAAPHKRFLLAQALPSHMHIRLTSRMHSRVRARSCVHMYAPRMHLCICVNEYAGRERRPRSSRSAQRLPSRWLLRQLRASRLLRSGRRPQMLSWRLQVSACGAWGVDSSRMRQCLFMRACLSPRSWWLMHVFCAHCPRVCAGVLPPPADNELQLRAEAAEQKAEEALSALKKAEQRAAAAEAELAAAGARSCFVKGACCCVAILLRSSLLPRLRRSLQ